MFHQVVSMSSSYNKRHHLPNGAFRNNADLKHTHASAWNVLKWKSKAPKVKAIDYSVAQDTKTAIHKPDQKHCVWIGHATFLLQYGGLNILTDPHFSDRASPSQLIGPKRTTKPALSITQLPHIDVIVISHDHYDHLDMHSVVVLYERQRSNPPLFVVPLKVGQWLKKHRISNWVELDWWQSTSFNNWRFHAVPVQHFSGRGLKPNNTLWAGWVMECLKDSRKPYKVFFAGDTGYSDDFKNINKQFGAMDLSFIPIGAYAPRWFMKEVHVNPDEAVRIHLDVKSKRSIGMHWGSFVLTDEPMDEPPKNLEEAKAKYSLSHDEFISVAHGEIIQL